MYSAAPKQKKTKTYSVVAILKVCLFTRSYARLHLLLHSTMGLLLAVLVGVADDERTESTLLIYASGI